MSVWRTGVAALLLAGCASKGVQPEVAPVDLEGAARINAQLGMDYLRQGNLASAEEKLLRAITQDAKQADAHVGLAILYSRREQIELAEKNFRRALSLSPNNPDALNNFGTFLCAQKRGSDGEKYLVQAAQTTGFRSADLAWTNAAICVTDSKPAKAEEYLREALKLNPASPDALAQFALISYRKSDFLRARAFLQRYEAAAPASAQTLWLRARTEAALGDTETAARYQQQLKNQFPEAAVPESSPSP